MKKIFIKRVHSFLENIYSCKKFSSFLQKFASIVDDFAITYRSKILLSQPHFYLLLFSLSLSSFCVSLVSLLRSYLPFFFFFPILFFPPSIRSTFEILNPVATPRGKDVECQRRVFDDEERKFSSFWNRGNDRNRGDLFSSWRDGFRRQTSNYSLCREKEKERDLDFLFLRALLDMADRVRVSHHSKTRDDDLRFRGGFFRLDRTGRCALMNVSNWWTINKRDSFADVYRDIINFSGRHQKFLTKFSVKRID